tara:strand:- start:12011 stop:12289 length:279 start_codon:yes stop_codon:yes gene_type:complete
MAKIKYKGEEKDIVVDNKAIMLFEINGGSIAEFDSKPIASSISLACACLGLKGDPLDHANDLPPMAELAESIKEAMAESGLTGETSEKKDNG